MHHLLTTELSPQHHYHNLGHTRAVVAAVGTLGRWAGLDEAALLPLRLAAWFHDTGFVRRYEGHEQVSQALLEEFLSEEKLPRDFVDPTLIPATHKDAVPQSAAAALLKDADLHNLGTGAYYTATAALRRELAEAKGERYPDADWRAFCIAFAEQHRYYSEAGRALYGPRKAINLRAMRRRTSVE